MTKVTDLAEYRQERMERIMVEVAKISHTCTDPVAAKALKSLVSVYVMLGGMDPRVCINTGPSDPPKTA
jgi:hypothetical protein